MCLPLPERMKRTILPELISFRRRKMILDSLRLDLHCQGMKMVR